MYVYETPTDTRTEDARRVDSTAIDGQVKKKKSFFVYHYGRDRDMSPGEIPIRPYTVVAITPRGFGFQSIYILSR